MSKENLKPVSASEFLDKIDILKVFDFFGHSLEQKTQEEYWAKSPFVDSDKKTSLKVNIKTKRWFDFESGKRGDVFDFIKEYKKCSFVEAMQFVMFIHEVSEVIFPWDSVQLAIQRNDARRSGDDSVPF